jgi:hypothetical protein
LRSSSFTRLCAAAVGAWGVAAAVHYHRVGLTLAHYDARAHLVVARRVFDSLMPGWQQVGAVWLPLPHLLNALPVQIDWLYRTGYSGVAISIASMALACWAIATLIHRATGSTLGGAVAAALLMLNPDVLYLQSTPMTEPLLFGTTFLAIALIAEWTTTGPLSRDDAGLRPPSRTGGPPSRTDDELRFGETAAPRSSRAAGWACVAAVLTRYEAWPIVAVAIVLALAVLRRRGLALGVAARAVRGLALWPLWAIAAFLVNSKVTVGSWFVSSGFFIPDNPALGHPWLAWTQVWNGLAQLTGPAVPWIAVLSAIAIVVAFFLPPEGGSHESGPGTDGGRRGARGAAILPLALVACAALPLFAYVQGHPVRLRYDVPLVAAAAALAGTAVGLLPRLARWPVALMLLAVAAWQAPPFNPRALVVVESQRDASNGLARAAVTAYLTAHWDGQPIMMSMGSLGHYMHDLSAQGFRIRDFLHEGTGELWKYAVRTPRPFAEWLVVDERFDRGDALYWQGRHDLAYFAGYARVAQGGGVALYRRLGN